MIQPGFAAGLFLFDGRADVPADALGTQEQVAPVSRNVVPRCTIGHTLGVAQNFRFSSSRSSHVFFQVLAAFLCQITQVCLQGSPFRAIPGLRFGKQDIPLRLEQSNPPLPRLVGRYLMFLRIRWSMNRSLRGKTHQQGKRGDCQCSSLKKHAIPVFALFFGPHPRLP